MARIKAFAVGTVAPSMPRYVSAVEGKSPIENSLMQASRIYKTARLPPSPPHDPCCMGVQSSSSTMQETPA